MDAVYTGLSEKFGVHNQEELADALQDAKERLLRCQPPTTAEVRIEKKKKRKKIMMFKRRIWSLSRLRSPFQVYADVHSCDVIH